VGGQDGASRHPQKVPLRSGNFESTTKLWRGCELLSAKHYSAPAPRPDASSTNPPRLGAASLSDLDYTSTFDEPSGLTMTAARQYAYDDAIPTRTLHVLHHSLSPEQFRDTISKRKVL
jgi:hypothetical protein